MRKTRQPCGEGYNGVGLSAETGD